MREFSRNNPKEDSITRNLVSRLSASAAVRAMAVVEYQFEPFRVDAQGNCVSTGKVDFVAHSVSIASPPGISLRETYVADECKRLNVQEATLMRYLAPRRHAPLRSVAAVATRKDQVEQGLGGDLDTRRGVVAGQRPC